MEFRKGKPENGRNTWYATVDNGRDLKLTVWKGKVEASLLTRSNGKVLEEDLFELEPKLRTASEFDPNDSGKKQDYLREQLYEWINPTKTRLEARAAAKVTQGFKDAKDAADALSQALSSPPVRLKSADYAYLEADQEAFRDLLRSSKIYWNFSVIKAKGGKILEARVHSAEIVRV